MAPEVEIYKGPAFVYERTVPLIPLIVRALRAEGALSHSRCRLVLVFHAIPDPVPVEGPPRLINLQDGYGYVTVAAFVRDRRVYTHPRTVRELLGPLLQRLVGELDPNEVCWGFRIKHAGMPDHQRLDRPAPFVVGAVHVDSTGPRSIPFRVRKVPEPEPPVVRPHEEGLDVGAERPPFLIVMPERVHRMITEELPLSDEVEEGGFLSGRVYRVEYPDDPADLGADSARGSGRDPDAVAGLGTGVAAYLLEIDHVTPAEHSGASLMQFTFTGDSFQAMNRELARHGPETRLLGWYHTHLFAATSAMGLSHIDVHLHFGTFRQPWQVAGLINLSDGFRVLRFYGRVGDQMQECPQWIRDERGRYRPAHPDVGDEPGDDGAGDYDDYDDYDGEEP